MFIYIKRKTAFSICIILSASLLLCALIPYATVVNAPDGAENKNEYIKWVDFSVPYEALSDSLDADIKSHNEKVHYNWIELLAYLASKYGGNWSRYKKSDLLKLAEELKSGKDMSELSKNMANYDYFFEAYSAVLGGFVGEYEIEAPDKEIPEKTAMVKKYGLKAFSPVARGYSYNHYDDFGSSRSYGYRRKHLGHDLMGGVGTPIIAIESGIVECVGWNQYGGWRIGIRSFDSKRYYYYAHLRKDHPYNDIYEGKVVAAGDVIGYLGMTGYSTKENVNNINTPHLHYGVQLIFDERQKDSTNEIWIDLYAITKLLEKNKSAVVKDADKNEYFRKYKFDEPILHNFKS
ncbi:MAG: M23 family metallopeptidase [Clostridia bacterium]|nr:M23 family metallopeptidase [Clostridia bacterium]